MEYLVDENEIVDCDLRSCRKDNEKTEAQKVVLLKLLCGLRNMFEVEKFITFVEISMPSYTLRDSQNSRENIWM